MMYVKTIVQEPECFRNKGGALQCGKIIKGTMSEAQLKVRVSSIPTRNENVIYQNTTQSAFGSSQKINSNNKSQLPGPGSYNEGKTHKKVQSKKGCGFFASKSKLRTLEGSRSHIPGPGSYITSDASLRATQRQTSSTKLGNRSTHQLFKRQLELAKEKPGVGSYHLNPESIRQNMTRTSSFKSRVERFMSQKNMQVPGVGMYQTALDMKTLEHTHSIKKKQEAKAQSEKERQRKIIQAIKNLQSKGQKQIVGPGTYTPDFSSTSKSFKIHDNIYDRFGELKPIYQLAKQFEPKQLLSSLQIQESQNKDPFRDRMHSTFKSTTKKWDITLPNQMDPAQYNTTKSPKKSHHVNFAQKWV